MDYETFVTEFLDALRNNNKKALSLIEQNYLLIQTNLGEDSKVITIDKFVNDLIDIVIQTSKNKFDVIKKTLKHDSMATVYRYFKNSNVMIRAVEANNKYALKWLISMNVNPYVKDENGMTVLMHVVQKANVLKNDLNSFIKIFGSDKNCINQEDNYGRTALFYTLDNNSSLQRLIDCDGLDINHKDHEGCTILIHCCKYGKLRKFKYLIKQKVDVNATDNEGRTAGMYLAMKAYYTYAIFNGHFSLHSTTLTNEYSTFVNLREAGLKINYVNVKGESILSMLLSHMYESNDPNKFDSYIRTLISLIFNGCNFNTPIDKDQNTALMVFLLVNDYESFNYICKQCNHMNMTQQNKNGESITSLYMKNRNNKFSRDLINKSPTFDIDYTDPTNGNNILMFSVITKPYLITEILDKKPDLLHEINHKGENALIIACKANNYESVMNLLKYPIHINTNIQDKIGNTALHYAIECRNPLMVQKLIETGVDIQLKNFNNQSPYDLAIELGDKTILEALKSNLTSEIIQSIKNNDQSKALEDIEEYLYPNISIIEYRCIFLTKEMIETESKTYKTIDWERNEIKEMERRQAYSF